MFKMRFFPPFFKQVLWHFSTAILTIFILIFEKISKLSTIILSKNQSINSVNSNICHQIKDIISIGCTFCIWNTICSQIFLKNIIINRNLKDVLDKLFEKTGPIFLIFSIKHILNHGNMYIGIWPCQGVKCLF